MAEAQGVYLGDGTSGVLKFLDPAYQAQQLAVQRQTAFQNGLPTDDQGNVDYGAAAQRLLKLGDYDTAEKFQTIGLQQNALATAQRNAASVGQYGGDPGSVPSAGGAAPGSIAGSRFLAAAGGGGIAPAAGGDDYNQQPGGGYAGVGQVGIGGQGGPSAAVGGAPAGGSAPAVRGPAGGAVPDGVDPMDAYAHSIGSIESSNRYDALGPKQANGAQAVGRYQVMTSNIGPWTREVLGTAMSPEEFRANPQAQDAVFRAKFGQAVDQYGNPWDAASVWFSGRPLNRAGNASDSLGTTVPAYIQKFAAGLGPAAQALRGGQGSPQASAPAGQASAAPAAVAPISFNSPATTSDANPSPGPAGAVTDSQVAAARQRLAAAQNLDPSSMSPAQQQQAQAQIDADQNIVDSHRQQQAQPSELSSATPASTDAGATSKAPPPPDVMDAIGRLKAGQGTDADKALWASWARTQVQGTGAAPAASLAAPATASAGTTSGIPSPTGDTPTSSVHPYLSAPARNAVPSAGGPAAAGGAQPISFGGSSTLPGDPPSAGRQPPQAMPSAAPQDVRPAAPQGGAAAAPAVRPALVPTVPTSPPAFIDPTFAGQVPDGWLKLGHTPGQWVNYARTQAAINGNLPFGAGKANQEAWNKIADSVGQSIDKGLQFTNEQRNARDPIAIGYERDRDAFKENARLQADINPARISFAGAQAAATAAGTAQGSAPYKFVPTQPVPGGPTVYTSEADLAGGNGGTPAVKEQPAVFGQKQEVLGKLDGEMQGQFQQRQVAHERLDALSNLLETFQSGAGAEAKAAAVAAVRAAGFNIPDSATANPAAVEQFSKNATANVFQNAKDMGGRVLVSELQGLEKANANPSMQPASNAAILAQQKGLLNWEDQHYQDYSTWRQANPYATDASGFETSWAKAHPIGAYVDAAKKDIAPLGAPLPAPSKLADGQAYIVKGQKVRWDAGSSSFVPFSGITAPVLPGQASPSQGGANDQGRQPQGQGSTQAAPPVAGARQARDGNWYVPDPSRSGKFLMVAR